MERKLKCPKCGKTQTANIFKNRGKVVAILFDDCGHSVSLGSGQKPGI